MRSPESADETLLGALLLSGKDGGHPFTTGDRKLVAAVASQAATAIYNARLVEELREATRIKRDLELAREIQSSLLPDKAPEVGGAEVVGRCVAANKIGGDYYGYVKREDGALTVFVGDVAGHDLGAALLMSTARATLLTSVSESDHPGSVLERTNRLLYNDLTSSHLLISLFVARYNPRNRRLRFANGGHNRPFLVRAGEDRADRLDADGLILGVREEMEYEIGSRTLAPGDVVLFYTDGIVEARDSEGRCFGDERLEEMLVESRTLPARAILDALYETIATFSGQDRLNDDATAVILKVT
jgi:serine phosphatase RsbU (regulator of sigma subunit)